MVLISFLSEGSYLFYYLQGQLKMKIRIKKGFEMAVKIRDRENRKAKSCKNRQSRATGNTGQTKHRTKTRKRE